MKSLLVAAAVMAGALSFPVAFPGVAGAADLTYPVKAPVAPAPDGYSWTGFHAGANLGYGGGNFSYPFDVFAFGGQLNGEFTLNSGGVFGGGQIGYDHQFDNGFVLGLEADLQWSGIKGDLLAGGTYVTGVGPATAVVPAETSVEWFGTVRARAGYGWDRLLVYATGGVAYGQVEWQASLSLSGPGFTFVDSIRADEVQFGWTAGAGVEYALTDSWVLRGEYLFIDFGSQTLSINPNPVISGSVDVQTAIHTGRAALSYRF